MTRPIILACLVALAASYGCGASARQSAIKAAYVATNSARDGFLAANHEHEASLTAHCDPAKETREQCESKVAASNAVLAAYQVKRAKVEPLFTVAYKTMAAAQILDDDPSIAGMQAAVAQLFSALGTLMGGK